LKEEIKMAVIRLDKIAGTHLESVKHTEELKNGYFVQLGALEAGETELYNVKLATTDDELQEEFLLHATPEVDPDPRKAGLKHFAVPAGEAGRAYHLQKGDVITLTEDLFDGTPVVGKYAVPQLNSLKLEASDDGTTLGQNGTTPIEPSLVFKVDRETTLGFDNMRAFVLRVVKA
jgi:hypothetical protein